MILLAAFVACYMQQIEGGMHATGLTCIICIGLLQAFTCLYFCKGSKPIATIVSIE